MTLSALAKGAADARCETIGRAGISLDDPVGTGQRCRRYSDDYFSRLHL